MKKTVLLCLLTASVITATSQITYSLSIPDTIPNYDGTYDDLGQNHLFYPNAGEIRFNDHSQRDANDVVKYYTMNTHPKNYILRNNNISFVYGKADASTQSMDSLHRIDIQMQGSNSNAFTTPVDTQTFAKLNYFTQWFGTSGRTDVAGSAAIACQSIYNNIDMVYTSNNAGLVMYFIVYPGGNFNDIVLHIAGSKSNSIVGNKLQFDANWESTTFQKPKMYQYTISNNVVTPVTVCNASWQSLGSDDYKINNATAYNPALPLIIQIKQANPLLVNTPGLCWSTYFGGYQYEFMTKTHTDASDNLYIAGNSNSVGNTFPQGQGVAYINAQSVDGAISKFNPAGILQWSAFVGGSANEDIRDFDFYGNSIFCVGRTSTSSGLLTQNKTGAYYDGTYGAGNGVYDGFIFEFEFDPIAQSVQKKWLTYYGGNHEDDLYGCKIDGSGNLYIIGASASSDMSTQALSGGYSQNFNALQLNPSFPLSTDAIIAKFNSAGAPQWNTFFGTTALGTNAHNHAGDYFYGIALAGNNVYVCGKAGGTDLPNAVNSKLVAGNFDGMLVHFTANGALNNTKFTDGNIANYSVKELWGEVYTAGEANSSMSPVNSGNWYYNGTASGSSDACFSIHSGNLSTTIHNSFLGGNDEDGANDIQFTQNNLLMISGGTRSSNFPVTSLGSMYSGSFAGGINDNFIACLQQYNTNLTWSSCLGSNFNESQTIPPFINSAFNLANTTICVDSQNRLRMLGSTTSYNTFPPDDGGGVPYFQATSGGPGNDGTITCFDMANLNTIVGLKDFENTSFVFGFYPNPTSKNISITNSILTNTDLRFAIYDINGKKLQSGNLKASDAKSIDVSLLSSGIYIINVSNGKMTYSNKFVKVTD